MSSTYEILKTPEWWVTVVIAGIMINLLSGYIKSTLDTRLSRISNWWNTRTTEKREKKRIYIDMLINDERFFALNAIRHVDSIKWTLMWFLMCVMAILVAPSFDRDVGQIYLMAFSSVTFFRSFQHLIKSEQYKTYAEEALTLKSKNTVI